MGTGKDVTIRELADLVCRAVGFEGNLEFDTSKPDGTPRKILDVKLLTRLGWRADAPLGEGVRRTVAWYLERR